uniref:Uncharacterized protein LOC111100615 n=1 Tax=Crassostrea virginica TaxID=6565 RepID=A0A8B8AA96_CRAVI|nr:uncharacterized protein LOC111100615 [Crassostrea virginica]
MILFVVFFGTCVFCLCAIALRKYKRNRSSIRISRKENCLHETGQVLVTRGKYDEIDIDMEVTFTSTLNRNEGKEIMSVKQYDGGCDVDESPYAECPENVYDKMFTARPHVNKVPENVYQSVEVGNSKYSMVKLISNHTS